MGPLPPEARLQFSAALQPPAGYKLDALVGATYSLDMLTALTVPLAVEARATVDRSRMAEAEIEALAALKRAASRVTIFVEAGRIAPFSTQASRLAALLEGSIHQVQPRRGTSFHPKFWVMRFQPSAAKAPVLTRLVILSRNLSQDQSWDAALRLDGEVVARGHDDNASACAFLKYLLKHGGRPSAAHKRLLEALGRTRWSLPAGYDEFEFVAHHPGAARSWTPRPCDRMVVVSPFCDDKGLGLLEVGREGDITLVSTDEWLAQLSPASRPRRCLVLSRHAAPENDGEAAALGLLDERGSGLHAKIYLAEAGRRRHLTIASGNATGAGLGGKNIEVFATLSGTGDAAGSIGLDADQGLLGRKGWGRLLDPWTPRSLTKEERNRAAAEQDLWAFRQAICEAGPGLTCSAEGGRHGMVLGFRQPLAQGAGIRQVRASLATRTDWRSWVSGSLELGPVALHEASLFVAFEVTHADGPVDTFVAKASGAGFPGAAERFDAALALAIKDADGFIRFANALLEPSLELHGPARGAGKGTGSGVGGAVAHMPVLEAMLDAYLSDDGHARMRALGEVVEIARRTQPSWLTPAFEELWAAFQDAGRRS